MIEAWHFVGDKLLNCDPVPEDGVVLEYPSEIVMCSSGLHASRRIIDALCYAPGNTICRVQCNGEIIEDKDQLVCSRRTILWRIDGYNVLRKFSRLQALSVSHLWDIPQIVREYLDTGDELKRDAAWAEAWIAAWVAATAAEGTAAGTAAWAAEGDAATAAAWAAAWASEGTAAWDAANELLTNMVMQEHEEVELK